MQINKIKQIYVKDIGYCYSSDGEIYCIQREDDKFWYVHCLPCGKKEYNSRYVVMVEYYDN